MYVPALNIGVGKKLCNGAFPYLDSLAFCLEDAVTADGVKESEVQLVKTLSYIAEHEHEKLPLLFVRVRDCSQFRKLPALLGETIKLLTGVIFPKFDLSNAADYCSSVGMINSGRNTPLHFMPILENNNVMSLDSRHRTLLGLRELLDGYREYVINVRVGAMDFCSLYGLRRSNSQTIYDIAVVRSVLTDILTVFADEYVVSAPVFEYFGSSESDKDWAIGLENELRLDSANGFIGKTIIHPSQLPFIRKSLQPTRVDFEDASAILDWSGGAWGVAKSSGGNRMNEVATHCKWAAKVITLAEIYGVKEL
jgi:citrate lyase beta subunit